MILFSQTVTVAHLVSTSYPTPKSFLILKISKIAVKSF